MSGSQEFFRSSYSKDHDLNISLAATQGHGLQQIQGLISQRHTVSLNQYNSPIFESSYWSNDERISWCIEVPQQKGINRLALTEH